jgi:Tfp pilus assembly protein PilE
MWSRRKPGEHGRSAGFVLIEVLVTAAVAAVLLAALMRAFSSVWGSVGGVREETEAMMVARAVIEASTPRNNLAALTQEGMIGRYAWSVAVTNTGIQSMAAADQQSQQQGLAGQLGPTSRSQPDQQTDQQRNTGDTGSEETREVPWTLFRVAAAVRAPSGRRTTLETFRLGRPAQR